MIVFWSSSVCLKHTPIRAELYNVPLKNNT
ncbi:hypothetical protein MAR_030551 [Mya arenaria]|uniref:Uncharacterized protein n=1 Tax=Mya arenaria TaxID=6604 RepID=A0ABY7F4H7_MYAAR|nr:hypothetical protein MAR_030551 [Mya arenaria]